MNHLPAPPTSALALTAELRVKGSIAAGSLTDAGTNHRYRYIILAGPPSQNVVHVLRAEIAYLRQTGWKRGTTRSVEPDGNEVASSPANYGSETLLYGPDDVYVALRYISGVRDLDSVMTNPYPGTPSKGLQALARAGDPLLSAALGHEDGR